jgi:DNA-binding response OmpR family regulator
MHIWRAKRILLISYDEQLLIARRMLLEREGYNVSSALGLKEALANCNDGAFDLLLLGHSIPITDKGGLIRTFRAHSSAPVLSLWKSSWGMWRQFWHEGLRYKYQRMATSSLAQCEKIAHVGHGGGYENASTRPMSHLDAWLPAPFDHTAISRHPSLNVLQVRWIRGWLLKPCGDSSKERLPLVILNVSRDPLLREARAKTLHDAGYYTSAAQTPEEAIELAAQLRCAIAIVCHSFTVSERRWIHTRLQEDAPTMTVVFLGESGDGNPKVLLSAVKSAVASRDTCNAVVWRLSFRP